MSCVKGKRDQPSAARDLYQSPLFDKMRLYADRASVPWFILSAEYGLVQPDEWVSPYELALADTSVEYRRVWGEWVVARLERLSGLLEGRQIELHAGRVYIDPLRKGLMERGAHLTNPLEGLRQGERLRWYNNVQSR